MFGWIGFLKSCYKAEPGMQEFESSKYLKATLEQAGFEAEVGGEAGIGRRDDKFKTSGVIAALAKGTKNIWL